MQVRFASLTIGRRRVEHRQDIAATDNWYDDGTDPARQDHPATARGAL